MCRTVDPEHRGMRSLVWKVEVEVKLETKTQILWFIVRRGGSTVSKFSSVSGSVVSNSLWPHGLQHTRLPCPSPILELTQIHVRWVSMPSNHLILCRPLLLLSSILSSIRVLSNKSVLHIRWPKYWSFSFSISPSNEYSGLISFRMDWLDLLAIQGTLKSLLQHLSSKASILWHSAFFTSNSYIHTWLLGKP